MKDIELRGILLSKYYDKRRETMLSLEPDDFDIDISIEDIYAISEQLGQHGLITWKSIPVFGGVGPAFGKITAHGIDVIEGEATSEIRIELTQNHTVNNISGSSNFALGNHNNFTVNQYISNLINQIENSNGTDEQKEEAKSLLKRFAEHPLVAAIAGGVLSGIF